MPKIRSINKPDGSYLMHQIFCPACRMYHGFRVGADEASHGWCGDTEAPTIYPDLVTVPRAGQRCHFTITQGEISYEPDSTHFYRGTIMDLPYI